MADQVVIGFSVLLALVEATLTVRHISGFFQGACQLCSLE